MGQSIIDLVEQIWAWVYCLVTNTVECKFFCLEMDMIVGGVVRIVLFFAQIFYAKIYEVDTFNLYINGACWFCYQLYILTVETKYIFFGMSITQKRQLIYKIMDYFQSIYGVFYVIPDQRNEYGELQFSTTQTVIFILFVVLMSINSIETIYQVIKYTCCFCCCNQQNEDYQTPGSIKQYFIGLTLGSIIGIIILSYTLAILKNDPEQIGDTYVIIMLVLEIIILLYAIKSVIDPDNPAIQQQCIDFLDIQKNTKEKQSQTVINERKLRIQIKNVHCAICGFCLGLFGIYIAHGICFSYLVYYIFNKWLCCNFCKCLQCNCCSCCFCCFQNEDSHSKVNVQSDLQSINNKSDMQKKAFAQQLGRENESNQYQTVRNNSKNY